MSAKRLTFEKKVEIVNEAKQDAYTGVALSLIALKAVSLRH
jgi:hypothetical protein